MLGVSNAVGARAISTLFALFVTAYCRDCPATCDQFATDHVRTYLDGTVEAAYLNGAPLPLGETQCDPEQTCLQIYLSSEKKPAIPSPPQGATYQAQNSKWTPLGTKHNCDLQLFVFETKAGASPTEQPSPCVTVGAAPPKEESYPRMRAATDAASALEAFRREPMRLSRSVVSGVSQSAPGIASEALEIAGQLVVDRASTKGFHVVQSRLTEAFECDETTSQFLETCAVVKALRIQEIAMAPELITRALGKDLLDETEPPANETSGALVTSVFELVKALVTRPKPERIVAARTVLNAFVHYIKDIEISGSSNAQKALLYGTLVAAKCVADTDDPTKGPACDVRQRLVEWEVAEPVRPAAAELAERLLVLSKDGISNNDDLAFLIGTTAEAACMVTAPVDSETADQVVPRLECPSLGSLKSLSSTRNKIAIWRRFALAVVTGDAASFALTASRVAQLRWDDAENEDKRKKIVRAIRLFAALTGYAGTYASADDGQEGATKHEQRTKILESLTNDLSNRLERQGDWVASLGGSLRVAGGARFATTSNDVAVLSPISLPLGLAVTRLTDGGPGFHLQVDVVELGNYVSLTKGPEVKEPEVEDALALGASVGLAWGTSDPLVLTASASYAPFVGVNKDSDDKGVLSVSLNFGVHVPLLDLN